MNLKNMVPFLCIARLGLSFTRPANEHVKFVYDGDSILLETGEKVMYLGIDAPQIGYEGKKSEFLAMASRDHNLRLVGRRREGF